MMCTLLVLRPNDSASCLVRMANTSRGGPTKTTLQWRPSAFRKEESAREAMVLPEKAVSELPARIVPPSGMEAYVPYLASSSVAT